MIDEALVTAEEFARLKYDLPDGGRWTELFAGRIITLQPPDEMHGNIVLNLSKTMAATYQPGLPPEGVACFDVGVLVQTDPDSVLSPAMSYFASGEGFGPVDEVYSHRVPRLVCEIASTNDRRRQMAEARVGLPRARRGTRVGHRSRGKTLPRPRQEPRAETVRRLANLGRRADRLGISDRRRQPFRRPGMVEVTVQ